ncbi:MAG: hypothetical protein WAK48_29320 [Candidatus Acidiferrum sp.]
MPTGAAPEYVQVTGYLALRVAERDASEHFGPHQVGTGGAALPSYRHCLFVHCVFLRHSH